MVPRKVLFNISYGFALLGGLVALSGAWMLSQPTEDANIGAWLVLIAAIGLIGLAVITGVVTLIIVILNKSNNKNEELQ